MVMRKIFRGLAVAVVLVCLFIPVAYATQTGQATLAVKQVFSGDDAPSEVFTYRLTPRTANAPLPAGSDAEGYVFTIAGTDEAEVGPIHFSAPGIYVYELRCVSEERLGYSTDQQVFIIEMHVAENLTVTSIVTISQNLKVPEILFEHSFAGEHTTTPPSTTSPDTPSTPVTTAPSRPSIPNTPNVPGKPDAPQTGDFSNPELWITLIIIGSILLMLTFFIAWKTRRRRS